VDDRLRRLHERGGDGGPRHPGGEVRLPRRGARLIRTAAEHVGVELVDTVETSPSKLPVSR
jgi:hypothetical protein